MEIWRVKHEQKNSWLLLISFCNTMHTLWNKAWNNVSHTFIIQKKLDAISSYTWISIWNLSCRLTDVHRKGPGEYFSRGLTEFIIAVYPNELFTVIGGFPYLDIQAPYMQVLIVLFSDGQSTVIIIWSFCFLCRVVFIEYVARALVGWLLGRWIAELWE